ncbi:sensor histidine kinase [Dyadobacter crusticola]|uniref:sensor histidine kinase n=1 Tax=Dyadobacter crusticola TaxID=292407 RepID=UPI0004E1B038|nr:histidine kinase [Dyadobacter crusticola]
MLDRNYRNMNDTLPVKNLSKLSWIVAFLSSVLMVIFLLGLDYTLSEIWLRFIQTFIFVGLTSLWNVWLFIRFAERQHKGSAVKKNRLYILSYAGAILVFFISRNLYSLVSGEPWEGDGANVVKANGLAILSTCTFNSLILLVQIIVVLQNRKAQSEIENLQLRANASDSANLLLRQQIHPHFLFNALNTIKSLYKADFQKGEDYLIHLANFLRVSISNQGTNTTLVRHELAFCDDYLRMQQIRFGSALRYTVNISANTAQKGYLPFFSLQPLIENALKHNSLTEEQPIHIDISESDDHIVVRNNLQPKSSGEISTGQGLANLAERYRLLAQELIFIHNDGSFFSVKIKILEQ